MMLKTPASPHIHANVTITTVMAQVLLALVPAIIAYTYFFGWGLLINALIAGSVALGCEAVMLWARQRPLQPFLTDGSALVTAVLLSFCLPPLAPWWIPALGALFAIAVAKHLYGGLGYNPFNPAMVGYVVLLISFPLEMTAWIPPHLLSSLGIGLGDSVLAVFTGHFPRGLSLDAMTAATPLDLIRTQLGLSATVGETVAGSGVFGDFGGTGWEWIGNWLFLGGVWLVYRRIISWHIPVAMLGTLFAVALLFSLYDPDRYTSPLFHIFSGGAMLGAFFIATDPVTAATTNRGRIIYGVGVGLLTYIIRTWGGYPDGVAFAVLLMNMAAPTIDRYTQPRVYGYEK